MKILFWVTFVKEKIVYVSNDCELNSELNEKIKIISNFLACAILRSKAKTKF